MFEVIIYVIMCIIYAFTGASLSSLAGVIYGLHIICPLMCLILGLIFGYKKGMKIRFFLIMGFMFVITSIFINIGAQVFIFIITYAILSLIGQLFGIAVKKLVLYFKK